MAETPNMKCDEGPKEESPTETETCPMDVLGHVERAEEAAENQARSGWWGDWLSMAKDKSAEVLGMVKKDLDELGTAVRSEASHVINSTSSAIGKTLRLDEPESTANTMKKSFSTFLDQVNTVLNPSPDDDDTEVFIITDGTPVPITGLQKAILSLQRLDATYLVEVGGPGLEAWRGAHTFPPPSATLQRALLASPVLRDKLERLVPAALDEDSFWERYLFRKALLEDWICGAKAPGRTLPQDAVVSTLIGEGVGATEEDKEDTRDGAAVVVGESEGEMCLSPDPRVTPTSASPSDSIRSNCGSDPPDVGVVWDNEDFAMDVELSEEQQMKLLEEYEEEIKSAKQSMLKVKTSPAAKSSPTKSASSPQLRQQPNQQTAVEKAQNKNLGNKLTKKTGDTSKSRSSETVANVQKTMSKKLLQGQKNVKQNKNQLKTDLQSKMVEDHFVDDNKTKTTTAAAKSLSEELAENRAGLVVDNASSNSDESWEKEFELDEVNTA